MSEKDVDDLTDEELKELAESLGDDELKLGSSPSAKQKEDLMNFFNNVLNRDDTTKVSNLSDEELDVVRRIQRAGLLATTVVWYTVARYIKKRGEIILATGLSGREKGGFFLKIINTSKKLLESVSKRGIDTSGGNKGWFKRKG